MAIRELEWRRHVTSEVDSFVDSGQATGETTFSGMVAGFLGMILPKMEVDLRRQLQLFPQAVVSMITSTPDQTRSRRGRWVRQFLVGWAVCTVVALFFSTQWFINPDKSGDWQDWLRALTHYLVTFYVWGLLTIGIVAITSRLEPERKHRVRSMIQYGLIGIGFCLAHMLVSIIAMWGWRRLTGEIESFTFPPPLHLLALAQSNMLFFVVIASVCLALSYYRKYRDRELRASRLKAQLTQSQLDALRSQLHPHFLFNTLNAIVALVRDDPHAAETMIARLSDLLRTILETGDRQEVSLQDELEFCLRYLEIEKIRFGERLVVESNLESGTARALVPSLILQPIVENAVRHGVSRTSQPCRIGIAARRHDDWLQIEIIDTGPGTRAGAASGGNGIGMYNTRDRLQHLYGDRHDLKSGNREQGGYAVHIRIPFHLSVDSAGPGYHGAPE